MYFSLFEELSKNELSHDDIEKIQEELIRKIYHDTGSNDKAKAQA